MRKSEIARKTAETDIKLSLEICENNSRGKLSGTSGIAFFDHMLNSFATHGGFNIVLYAEGDLQVDCHHTVEDVGIVLGKALLDAAGNMDGIARFSDIHMPMDEALCLCAVDFSGRPFLVLDADFKSERLGDYDTQMTEEFMRALAFNAKICLHIKVLYGQNDHHITEAVFKAAGKCIGSSLRVVTEGIPSAKGVL